MTQGFKGIIAARKYAEASRLPNSKRLPCDGRLLCDKRWKGKNAKRIGTASNDTYTVVAEASRSYHAKGLLA